MKTAVLKRQFITDTAGKAVGVILPLEQFALVEQILEQHFPTLDEAAKLDRMERAAQDSLFMADLSETMAAFAVADTEWWESDQ